MCYGKGGFCYCADNTTPPRLAAAGESNPLWGGEVNPGYPYSLIEQEWSLVHFPEGEREVRKHKVVAAQKVPRMPVGIPACTTTAATHVLAFGTPGTPPSNRSTPTYQSPESHIQKSSPTTTTTNTQKSATATTNTTTATATAATTKSPCTKHHFSQEVRNMKWTVKDGKCEGCKRKFVETITGSTRGFAKNYSAEEFKPTAVVPGMRCTNNPCRAGSCGECYAGKFAVENSPRKKREIGGR